MAKSVNLIEKDIVGEVIWFNKDEKRGKIRTEQYGDIFVHSSRITHGKVVDGVRFLKRSQRVKCDIIKGPKGLQANNVQPYTAKPDKGNLSDAPRQRQRNLSGESSTSTATDDFSADDISVIEYDLRGEVVNYNRKRGFGFVMVRQYGSIFCHVSHIDFPGLNATEKALEPTQIVRCDVGRKPDGKLMALKVSVISEATSSKEAHDLAAKDKKSQPSQKPGSTQVKVKENEGGIKASNVLGEVIAWKPKQKFGFISVQGFGTVFVHRYGLLHISELIPKQIVKCDITDGKKSFMAINVRAVNTDGSVIRESAPPMPIPIATPPIHAPPPLMNPVYPYPHMMPPGQPYTAHQYPGPSHVPNYNQAPFESPPPYQEMAKLHLSGPAPLISPPAAPSSTKPKKSRKSKNSETTEKGDSCKTVSSTPCLKCEICEDNLDNPVTTPCEHLFCRECIDEWLAYNPTCPVDGKAVSKKSIKSAPQYVLQLLKSS